MSVLVRLGRRAAILRGGKWISADSTLEYQLNTYTSSWFQQGRAPWHAKDQERAVAEEIAREFGGRVTMHVPTRRKASERYFLNQRQLKLDLGPR